MKQEKMVRGILRLKNNYGFLVPVPKPGAEAEEEDFFVAPDSIGAAMDGDEVLARREMSRGREVAVIERVVARASEEIVGTVDWRGREPLLICEKATEPIRLLFEGKGPGRPALKAGYKVTARIKIYPTEHLPAAAVVTSILGEAGDPAVELAAAKFAFSVPGKNFPPEVAAAAKALPDRPSDADLRGRLDLRQISTFTIDPTDARDFDDAVSIESGVDGFAWRVGIHIADVSHYVKEGSVIDQEAYKRATSTYLPGEVIPMLPERLSNNLCSLVEGEDRLTVSIMVDCDADFEPQRFRHTRSVIRSCRRFTYDEVDVILDSGQGDLAREIGLLRRVAGRLNEIRMERGAIDLDMPEEKPVLDTRGKVIEVRKIARTWSHRLIEELMICANEYAARAFKAKGIYRIHEPPAPLKLMNLRQFVRLFGKNIKGGPREVLEAFKGQPSQKVVETMVLRSMQEAKYSHRNVGHYGLASKAYTHFTSPIRRYPDAVVHRLLLGEKCERALPETAVWTSRRERESMLAERDAVEIKLLEYAEGHLGETVDGVIDNVVRDGCFVSLDFGPRGFLPADSLGPDRFHYDRESASLTGRKTGKRYRLGDAVRVKLVQVDISRRRLTLGRDLEGKEGGEKRERFERRIEASKEPRSDRGGERHGNRRRHRRGR